MTCSSLLTHSLHILVSALHILCLTSQNIRFMKERTSSIPSTQISA